MQTKEIIIGFNFFDDLEKSWKSLEKGEEVKENEAIYFETVEAMNKFLTPLRIEILRTIKKKKPSSIYELAKILEMDPTNLNKQIKTLADVGLLELEQEEEARKKIIPLVLYDEIDVKISLVEEVLEG